MNLKLKAGLYTAGLIGAIYIGLSVIRAIFQAMPESWRENSFYTIVIGLMLYGVYMMVYSTLEFNQKMKNITDRL